MSSKRTLTALIARGFDTKLAEALVRKKYTLNKLKGCSRTELLALGLNETLVEQLHDENRPPIPTETVYKLLYESRRTCCVCRVPRKPIIIHHMAEWSTSRNHNEDNLVVLCLYCHDEAHTRRTLSLNLTADQLQNYKARWNDEVKASVLEERTTPSEYQFGIRYWDYLNHNRILDAAAMAGVEIAKTESYEDLVSSGKIEKSGSIVLPSRKLVGEYSYLYEIADRSILQFYFNLLAQSVLKMPVVDLTDSWERSTACLITSGTVVIFAGGWRFRKDNKGQIYGPGQMRTGYVQKQGIKLIFSFDAWETTTNSSRGNLSGSWPCTVICLARSVESSDKQIVIRTSVLAIGTGFKMPHREPPDISRRESY